MREKRTFAERTSTKTSDEVNRKYFLVYEGTSTEVKYFDAINSMKNTIGINPIIELIPLIRSYSENNWSNPKKILDRIILNIEEEKTSCISYETFLNRFMDYFYDERIISNSKSQAKNVWKFLIWICEEKLGQSLESKIIDIQKVGKEIIQHFKEETNLVNIVVDISDIIKASEILYDEDIDKICLIVDRDRDSFVSHPNNNQYEYVLNKCKENGFGFYITNPCFEFWLLLHFDEVHKLDKDKLLDNIKVTSKCRYAEYELRKIFYGYSKSSYHVEKLVVKIDKAINNEKAFCEDEKQLENEVGSNIGLLIKEMMN